MSPDAEGDQAMTETIPTPTTANFSAGNGEVVSSATTTQQERTLARIVGSRPEVAAKIREQLELGTQVRDLRIRYAEDLDDARTRKQAWVKKVTELLSSVFDNSSVADYCNDWVGKIFPEYAEFGNFVEQFYEEMAHRLGRLRAVSRRVEQGMEPQPAPQPAAASAPAQPADVATPAAAAEQAAVPVAPVGTPRRTVEQPAPVQSVVLLGLPAECPELSEPLARFLSELGIATVPLVESANSGDWTEAIDKHSSAGFAIVSAAAGDPRLASFRLGYAAGTLGTGHLCVVHPAGTISGVEATALPHLSLDAGGGWQLQLARQLKRAGLSVDLNRLC
jgi:hypothetical protein